MILFNHVHSYDIKRPFIKRLERTDGHFWSKVEQTSTCWNWIASKNPNGYAQFRYNGKLVMIHRFSYELFKGKIPEGLELDHLCRNRLCVNPDHLEAVTHEENCKRGNGVGSINAAKTHCPQGHEYTPKNTRIKPNDGARRCRKCLRIQQKEHRRRKRNAV